MITKGLLDAIGERQGARAPAEAFVGARLNLVGALRTSTRALQLDGLSRTGRQSGYLAVIVQASKLGSS